MPRLVMIHGVCSGIGQTTLGVGLAEALGDCDYIEEDLPACFERPEFAAVGARFKAHNEDRSAGIGCPTPDMLEDAYRNVVGTLQQSGRTGVMDWSFADLSEDLDWAEADLSALHEHSRRVREIMKPLDPVTFYLEGDIRRALDRAANQRGRGWAWFGANGLSDPEWEARLDSITERVRANEQRVLGTFAAGGWELIRVDGFRPKEEILDDALAALAARGIRPATIGA